MEKIIRLWSDGKGWIAEYEGPEADDIKRLMGSSRIPTAFTARASREEVIKRMSELNPGYKVV